MEVFIILKGGAINRLIINITSINYGYAFAYIYLDNHGKITQSSDNISV